jgi:hypothetical protein
VHAGVLFKTQSWRKIRRDRVFTVVEEKHIRLVFGGITRLRCRRLSSVENHFIKFAEVLRRENGRLKFSMENSRSPTNHQISQSSRGVTTSVFKGFKLRRDRAVDPSQQESLDLVVDFHFGVSGVGGLKSLYHDSRNREVRSPKKVESLVVGQHQNHVGV